MLSSYRVDAGCHCVKLACICCRLAQNISRSHVLISETRARHHISGRFVSLAGCQPLGESSLTDAGLALLLFPEVGSALLKEIYLTLKDVADLLQKALLMMKDVVFILDKGQSEHKENTRGAAQGLLTFLRAQEGLYQVVSSPRIVEVFLFL